MADTQLVLGDITFAGVEIPESMPFGGDQRLSPHEYIGGIKTVDAMGAFDRAIEWSGWLLGKNATDRALYLDARRKSGLSVTLTWGKLRYTVVVRSFQAEYQRFYQIRYRISCEVVSNQTTAPHQTTTPVDQAINTDAVNAALIAQAIANQQLIALIASVQTAIAAVSSIATASRSGLAAIALPIQLAQTQVSTLIDSTTESLGTPTTFGGMVSGGSPEASIAALNAQTGGASTLTGLLTMQGLLGRMALNVQDTNVSPNTLTVSGGNLFQIAEQQFGDAAAWTAIANANGLTDPFISGTDTLILPLQPDNADGVLNA